MFKAVKATMAIIATATTFTLAAPASAALITYDFTGTVVNSSFGVLFAGKTPGDNFDASFTIDTDATVRTGHATTKLYDGAFDVTVEGISFTPNFVQVLGNGNVDAIIFHLGIAGGSGSLRLISNASGAQFINTNLDLPISLPPLSTITSAYIHADHYDNSSIFDQATLTSLSLQESAVPTPGTLALLGFGLFGLSVRRRTA